MSGPEFVLIDYICTVVHQKYMAAGNSLDARVVGSKLRKSKRDQDREERGNATVTDEQPSVVPSDILQLGGRATVSCREWKY